MDKTTPEMIHAIEVTENNENHEACTKCGGVCCVRMGCDVYPQDVKRWFNRDTITKEMIITLLDSGKVMMDWWEGDVRYDEFGYDESDSDDYLFQTYYLHMRDNNSPAIKGSWGGVCKCFEIGKGCTIPWDKRPTGGRALIPNPDGNYRECGETVQNLSKNTCCLAWVPYQDILEEIYSEYKRPVEPEGSSIDALIRMINGGFL